MPEKHSGNVNYASFRKKTIYAVILTASIPISVFFVSICYYYLRYSSSRPGSVAQILDFKAAPGGKGSFIISSLFISVIALIICVIFAYEYLRKKIQTLGLMKDSIEKLSSNSLNYRLNINNDDYIGELADSINRLADSQDRNRDNYRNTLKELRRNQKELEFSNRHLKEASRLRSEFISNMSHELRTPMNTIIGYTSIILDGIYGELNEKQETSLRKVFHNANKLSNLINDILDLSKIEAGKMPVFKERFMVSKVVKEAVQSYLPIIEEKNLDLIVDIRNDVEIESDFSKVKNVLNHLIDNAVKFTLQGSITIVTRISEKNDYVKISVLDKGIGICDRNLETIFDEFRQIDGSLTREFGGTGLGLSIAKKMLNLIGAKITVKSILDKGSNFTVYLPLEISGDTLTFSAPIEWGDENNDLSPVNEENGKNIEEDVTKKIILAIDDDKEFLNIMKDIVRGTNFRVVAAKSAYDGLEIAKKLRPYLITTDIVMPEKTGWDLIKKLKCDPITLDIPIFMISVLDERARAFSLGVSEYFIKPVERKHFMERLSILERCKGRRALIIDDNPDFLESIFLIMREQGYQTTTVDNGREGLQRILCDRPDVVILDLMMPQVSGYDILDAIEKENIRIPVILMTAKELSKKEMDDLKPRVFSILRKTGITRCELAPRLKSVFERIWCENASCSGYSGANMQK